MEAIMKKGLTEIVFILDRSGSMSGLEKDTIGGFNTTLEKQKKEEGEAFVSTVLFDGEMEVLHDRVRQMVKRQKEKYGWEFIFLGANIDAIETARNYGIDEDRAANFVNDEAGIGVMYAAQCCLMSDIRNNRSERNRKWAENVDGDFRRRQRQKA